MFDHLAGGDSDDEVRVRRLLSLAVTAWAAAAALCASGSLVLGGPLPPVADPELPPAYLEIAATPGGDPLPALPHLPEPPRAPLRDPAVLALAELAAPVELGEHAPDLPPALDPEHGSIACDPLPDPVLPVACDPPRPPAPSPSAEPVLRRKVEPAYPRAAMRLGLPQQRCLARVAIDAMGTPTAVEVTGCPAVFHPETRRALLQWRWYPARSGPARVPSETRVSVVYR